MCVVPHRGRNCIAVAGKVGAGPITREIAATSLRGKAAEKQWRELLFSSLSPSGNLDASLILQIHHLSSNQNLLYIVIHLPRFTLHSHLRHFHRERF